MQGAQPLGSGLALAELLTLVFYSGFVILYSKLLIERQLMNKNTHSIADRKAHFHYESMDSDLKKSPNQLRKHRPKVESQSASGLFSEFIKSGNNSQIIRKQLQRRNSLLRQQKEQEKPMMQPSANNPKSFSQISKFINQTSHPPTNQAAEVKSAMLQLLSQLDKIKFTAVNRFLRQLSLDPSNLQTKSILTAYQQHAQSRVDQHLHSLKERANSNQEIIQLQESKQTQTFNLLNDSPPALQKSVANIRYSMSQQLQSNQVEGLPFTQSQDLDLPHQQISSSLNRKIDQLNQFITKQQSPAVKQASAVMFGKAPQFKLLAQQKNKSTATTKYQFSFSKQFPKKNALNYKITPFEVSNKENIQNNYSCHGLRGSRLLNSSGKSPIKLQKTRPTMSFVEYKKMH